MLCGVHVAMTVTCLYHREFWHGRNSGPKCLDDNPCLLFPRNLGSDYYLYRRRHHHHHYQSSSYWRAIGCNITCEGDDLLKNIRTILTLYHTIPTFNDSENKPFENMMGKGENAGNQHFLLFPQCFIPYQSQKLSFQRNLFRRLQILSNWISLFFFFFHLVKS